MGLVPLGVLWIFISWVIVLFGLQLAFTTQHLRTLDAAEIAAARKTEEYFLANDFTVINVVKEIAAAFEQNNAPLPLEVICSKLNIPAEFGEKILNHLVNKGIIVKVCQPTAGFIPATDPANIRLSDIAEAVAAADFGQLAGKQPITLQQIAQSQRGTLAQYSLKQILDDT
jgi:membrane protein